MAGGTPGYAQIENIIRRAQTLIINVKLLGADISMAKDLLSSAREALNKEEYDSALQFAMASLKEVMRLKKEHKEGKLTSPLPTQAAPPPASPPPGADAPGEKSIPMAEPIRASAPTVQDAAAAGSPGTESGTEPAGAPPAETGKSEKEIVDDKGRIFGTEFLAGLSYLIEEDRADKCFVIYQKLSEKDFTGLIITRSNPKIIKKRYQLTGEEMLWLTDRESTVEPTIMPSLENMIYVIEEFIDSHNKPMMLLDGLEYLISNNTFNSVLRFIRRLIDKISETDAILLIGVSQLAIQEQELKLLEKELTPVLINN